MVSEATPKDSRYIPFTQQASCCVPTSILMVMYKNDIPLMPAEELGWHLGLTVHPDKAKFFHKVRTSETPPPAGYGTQIYKPQYEPSKVFANLGIPLKFSFISCDDIEDGQDLIAKLQKVETKNGDALLCYNHGVVKGRYKALSGHVVVFDRVIDGKIRIVDPSPNHPKWRLVEPSLMYLAMKRHGVPQSAGIWLFTKK